MKKNLLIIVALLIAAGSLQAASITQTNTFSGTPNYTSYLTFDKFNTMGGTRTLTGVNVSIFLLTEAQGSVGVDNDGASSASGIVRMGSKLTVTSAGPTLLNSLFQTLSPLSSITSKSLSLDPDDGDAGIYSTVGTDFGFMNVSQTQGSDSIVIGGQFLSGYSANGVDTFIFNAAVDQSTDFSSFGGSQVLIDPMSARGNVVVSYDYTVIPEPATASMMALVSLVGFLIRRRFMA